MKNALLPGNVLDRELQACQNGQTKGIAIGPDTSLGIAEMLLAPLDARLKKDCNILAGTRFIDDIELAFSSLSDADQALATLEKLLNEIELQLNASKTRIVTLPSRIESFFVTDLRRYVPSNGAPSSQWIDYFNRAFDVARANPEDSVLRYAVSALQNTSVKPMVWDLAQELLCQCVALDPGTLRFVVDVLVINNLKFGLPINAALASNAVNALISTSAGVGHGSEVLWSIWAALYLGLQLSPQSQNAIAQVDDALVASAAMFAKSSGLFHPGFDSPLWRSWLIPDSFRQEYWLFAYEALLRGWFPAETTASQISNDADASFLASQKVTFINDNAHHAYLPAKVKYLQTGGKGY
jgi:hypothetical protein